MKTATLDVPFDTRFDSRFGPELLQGVGLHRAPAASAGIAESQPVFWRSEAFAEDLSEPGPSEPAVVARAPLLRRALAAVLRR